LEGVLVYEEGKAKKRLSKNKQRDFLVRRLRCLK
jgi:hypothetical protein